MGVLVSMLVRDLSVTNQMTVMLQSSISKSTFIILSFLFLMFLKVVKLATQWPKWRTFPSSIKLCGSVTWRRSRLLPRESRRMTWMPLTKDTGEPFRVCALFTYNSGPKVVTLHFALSRLQDGSSSGLFKCPQGYHYPSLCSPCWCQCARCRRLYANAQGTCTNSQNEK